VQQNPSLMARFGDHKRLLTFAASSPLVADTRQDGCTPPGGFDVPRYLAPYHAWKFQKYNVLCVKECIPSEEIQMPRPKSKVTNGTTKADLIRRAAKTLPKPIRPRDIIAVLKAKGVEVSSAQVSTTLRASGFRRRRRHRPKNARAIAGRVSPGNGINLDALLAAKALIQKVGSVDAAEEALRALKRLA
jgi:hypothetical protein